MPCLPQWKFERLTARNVAIDVLLVSLDAALAQLIANPTISYTLSTGQTSQQVTRASIPQLKQWANELRAEQDGILDQLYGTPRSAYFRPGF